MAFRLAALGAALGEARRFCAEMVSAMAPEDITRVTLGVSALAGGVVWGLYHLTTALLAGQPVHRQDVILAALNVAAAILMGMLVAYFVGPAITPMVPLAGLRDPHAVGFAIGAVAWEAAPYLYKGLRYFAAKKADEVAK